MKIMQIVKCNATITKQIMKIIKQNHRISFENHANHENIRIPINNFETNENLRIPIENNENHENLRIP